MIRQELVAKKGYGPLMVLGDSELSVNSAYNTYTRKGLPVGPICNPSMDAVVAALYPDDNTRQSGARAG